MYNCKLESHLETLCRENPEYTNLYSTWTLNKKACSDALKSVVIHYPHFSMHDESHACAVVSKIEMLLGLRVRSLSPTDTWLLLHAAYAHDLGMVVQWQEIEKVWREPEFEDFLTGLKKSTDRELREAAEFILDCKNITTDFLWPLKTHRFVNRINSEYFRKKHAQSSQEYIHSLGKDLNLDLGHSNLIQPRILNLLGQVCGMHTAELQDVLSLDYQTDGYASDYAHPRFVAMLLRLGDLLDVDNGRFNEAVEVASGQLPESSVPHKDKHEATTHLLVTPKKIQFTSDCPNSDAYFEARNFVDWLENEIDFLTIHWAKIVPEGFDGYAPEFDKKELLIEGEPDIKGVTGLQFNISQEKAFELIEGESIYSDKFVFVREVIQNALDATKVQLWRDLCSDVYHAWLGDKDLKTLQPYDLEEKIYHSYPICVTLSTLTDGKTQIEITDRGTGISVDSFKRMCHVGYSNEESYSLKKEIEAMPKWLRPTAGFGIGLQSIFLVADRFEIETSTGLESFHAIVHSNRKGGQLKLQRAKHLKKRGTTIRVQYQMPEYYRYSMFGDTEQYIESHFDPMAIDNRIGEVRTLEAIRFKCQDAMFPIKITSEGDTIEDLSILHHLPDNRDILAWNSEHDRYVFKINENYTGIKIWDKQTYTYGELSLAPMGTRRYQIRFRGIEVNNNTVGLSKENLNVVLDAYGLDTKLAISLDRASLTLEGKKQYRAILDDILVFYLDNVLTLTTKMTAEECTNLCRNSGFSPYAFWCLCDPERRKRIPRYLIEEIVGNADIICKDETGYTLKATAIKDLIPRIPDLYFANISPFYKDMARNIVDHKKICTILTDNNCDIEEVVLDTTLTEIAQRQYFCQTLELLDSIPNLLLYKVSENSNTLIDVSDCSKDKILRGLSARINGMDYGLFYYNKDQPAKRHAIPAISKYRKLAVTSLKHGIACPHNFHSYYIISPFIREQAEAAVQVQKDVFIRDVMTAETFEKIVDFVRNSALDQSSLTRDAVIAEYKRLISDYHDLINTNHDIKYEPET